jgi:hypothetical protein
MGGYTLLVAHQKMQNDVPFMWFVIVIQWNLPERDSQQAPIELAIKLLEPPRKGQPLNSKQQTLLDVQNDATQYTKRGHTHKTMLRFHQSAALLSSYKLSLLS